MSDNREFDQETTDEIVDSLSRPGQKIANKQRRKINKKIRQGITKVGIKMGKTIGKAFLILIKTLLPYISVTVGILLIVLLGYFIVFEFTGTEKEYAKKYENEVTINNDGTYMTSESQMNKENKVIRDFYKYFAGQSFWKLINDDNETIYSPDDIVKKHGKEIEVRDYYKREDMFKLPANLLYSLDEYMFSWTWKYPEQFTKPVNFDKDKFGLLPISDKDGMIIVESDEEDIKTGEKTGKKITSMRDYGLASVLKYNEKEDYKRTLKVKGEYVAKDVWNDEKKQVESIKIKPQEFEIEMKPPEPIWLIDKVALFTGNIEYKYEYKQTKYGDLVAGSSENEKDPKIEIIYDYHKEKKDGYTDIYPLKKYRSSESMIVEELPVVVNTVTDDKKDIDYFEDYLYNFESYVPTDVTDDLIEAYKDKIDYDSYVFDYDKLLIDDYGFGLGNSIESEKFKYAYEMHFDTIQKHAEEFGVDPYTMLAIITQESGGRTLNKYGVMQIYGGDRNISVKNAYGEITNVSITAEEKQDASKSIRWGTAYFKYLLDLMDGNQYKAVQAYNLGEGTLMKIKNEYPDAWNSDFGWLIHREWARRQNWPNAPSISYNCMAFPEGQITNGNNAAGDSCFLENTLQYYAGRELENVETDGESAWNGIKNVIGDIFKNLIPLREKGELVPKIEFVNHIKETRLIDILMTTQALNEEILFSEVLGDESLELKFWDDGFMDVIGSEGLSIQDILNIAPNPGGYWRPIIIENGIRITSYFGKRNRPTAGASTFHKGIDIGASTGTPVYATASGKVVNSSYQEGGAGRYIKIDHGEGIETLYMHLSDSYVEIGQEVKQGQNIAAVGNTGVSTGSHLHFEFRKNGIAKDPISIILGEGEINSREDMGE